MVGALSRLQPAVQATGFWSAVCLPWVALGFVMTGTVTTYPLWFSLVVLAAGVAAVIGKDYTTE